MVKFAADCRAKMNLLTIQLETTLGPGTADLKLRLGLHSGSVTAGVLRNDKSRFQLFGDTVRVVNRVPLARSIGKTHRFSLSRSLSLS
jgi:class 3 adenylate cyclase